ncbi:MAG: ADP-ribosylglycohydrolase family protein [Rhodobacteraceae bacterium]|nr:ADP-ribosylglycohydrolase family protein [Paracoccaceae bacterium]
MKPFCRNRARGMLVGLAVGDAVGTTVEFCERGSFPEVTDMIGGGKFQLEPGQWTDDTSMALCLADSLLHAGGWDAADCMRRFLDWHEEGHNSVTGECFDIGTQTTGALTRFKSTGAPYAGPTEEAQSGNGGLMRLAPVVIAFGADPDEIRHAARLQSRTTHGSETCLRLAADMATQLATGHHQTLPVPASPPEEVTGYAVHTYDAACWAVGHTSTFRDAILAVVNLGGDADTAGAIAGQIAGAFYGYDAIPEEWRERLWWHDEIVERADRLWHLIPNPPDM